MAKKWCSTFPVIIIIVAQCLMSSICFSSPHINLYEPNEPLYFNPNDLVKCGYPFVSIVNTIVATQSHPIEFIHSVIRRFKFGQNIEVISALDYAEACIVSYIKEKRSPRPTSFQLRDNKLYRKELAKHKIPDCFPRKLEEVFYYHHGMRFAPKGVQKYVAGMWS